MRIVAAIDESEAGRHLLEVIGGWAARAGTGVDLLCVINPEKIHETANNISTRHELTPRGTWSGIALRVEEPPLTLAEDRTQAMERARTVVTGTLLQLAAAQLPGTDYTAHVVFAEDPAKAICDYAVEMGAAAIAIGSRGRSHLRSALFGSVAEAVIRASSVPVLVIRADMAAPHLN